jgi:hypothetical protein
MTLLDWTTGGPNGAAGVLEHPKPCGDCGRPTFLLEPGTRKPRHKVCAEADLAVRVDEITGRAA